jgi:hypothetical protein
VSCGGRHRGKPDNATPFLQVRRNFLNAYRREFGPPVMLSFSAATKPKPGSSMKNLFQPEAVDEVISRVDTLQPATQRLWGKMDVAQMMAHCSAALDMAAGPAQSAAHVHWKVDRAVHQADLLQR